LIQERVRIEDCLICSEQKASVICMPCEHLCACESCAKLMKKCIVCRLQIEAHVSIKELYKTSEQNATENDPFKPNVEQDDVKKLQQQLQDIKEQVLKKLL
jgi:E3 ubiquitin-protein ligase mind-bomb